MKKEKMEYAMNLLTSMVIRQEAYDKKEDCIKVFKDFRRSRTYDALFDPSTGLWMNGPDYILDEYRMEKDGSNTCTNPPFPAQATKRQPKATKPNVP